MARFFREKDIDEFRECFYLHARSGQIKNVEDLSFIMRSLGMSPTVFELKKYFKDKNGKLSFADFLDVMHIHTEKENVPKEILDAFEAADRSHKGQISVRELKHILLNWGEKLTQREVDQIFRETNVSASGYIRYNDFVKILSAPIPDYY